MELPIGIDSFKCKNRVFRLMSESPARISRPLNFNKFYVLRVLCQFHGYIGSNLTDGYFVNRASQLLPSHDHSTRINVNENLHFPPTNTTITQKQFFIIQLLTGINYPNA